MRGARERGAGAGVGLPWRSRGEGCKDLRQEGALGSLPAPWLAFGDQV